MMTDQEIDRIESELDWFDRLDRANLAHNKALLMKLNKAELQVLANHYKLHKQFSVWCFEPHDYKHGGKEEVCEEIAEAMIAEGTLL